MCYKVDSALLRSKLINCFKRKVNVVSTYLPSSGDCINLMKPALVLYGLIK